MDYITATRTNSLAFARSDCFTCSTSGASCDRRRPQCSTCLDQGLRCAGFATPLRWDDSRMLATPSSSRSDRRLRSGSDGRDRSSTAAGSASTSRFRRFVASEPRPRKQRRVSRPAYDRQTNISLPDPAYQGADDCVGGISQPEADSNIQEFELDDDLLDPLLLTAGPPSMGSEDSHSISVPNRGSMGINIDTHEPCQIDQVNEMQIQSFETALTDAFPLFTGQASDIDIRGLDGLFTPSPLGTPPTLSLGSGLTLVDNHHELLLRMYDTDFCILPLTSDAPLNPFRCRRSNSSNILLHAIIALCCHHLYHLAGNFSVDALEHQRKARQLLDQAIETRQSATLGLVLLDPALILFTLDCAVSASGEWSNHLKRAYTILEKSGGPAALNNPMVRSKAAMLVWWDATLALISRQGAYISNDYLEHLVQFELEDEWSFYDLTGCPGVLVSYMSQLTELAQQNELACSMKWLSFDLTPIDEIDLRICEWTDTKFALPNMEELYESHSCDAQAEEAFHVQQDRYHCVQAWRHTLLLYIQRVFRWDRQKRRPGTVVQLSRTILNHIRCCRQTSQTQKQLLLPAFLAGSECNDEDMRNFVRDYCKYWGTRTRYHMFNTASLLLEEIWASQPMQCWIFVVDGKTKVQKFGQHRTQYLFG